MTIEQTWSRRFSIESCTVPSSLALDIYNHCTVYNSPPTTLSAGILLAQTAPPSSSSPSSVIRINCYKGNICTPQILLVLVGKILPLSFPSHHPKTYKITGGGNRIQIGKQRPINIQLCCPIHSIVPRPHTKGEEFLFASSTLVFV